MTKVRLIDSEKWPVHKKRSRAAVKNWPLWRGCAIVIGKPRKPSDEWTCGTDVVWPVLEYVDGPRAGERADSRSFVCRHQIQAGD